MPINFPLFQVLQSVDPACTVVSEGEPAEFFLPSRSMGCNPRGQLYASVSRWGESYRMNCPFCGDTGQHLYFCHLAGATVMTGELKTALKFGSSLCVCHRRQCQREVPEFRDWLNGLKLFLLPQMDLLEKGQIVRSKLAGGLCMEIEDALPRPTYPLLSDNTPEHIRAWLERDRRYDPYYLQSAFCVGYSPSGALFENRNEPDQARRWRRMFDERLIIPTAQGLSLVGWQGRLARQQLGPRDIKYLNSPNMRKANILYNLDNAMAHDVVVLVEGVFDTWRVGEQAVAVLGHTLSPSQKLQLKAVYGRTGGCIVMMDAQTDAPGDNINHCATRMAEDLLKDGVFPRGVVPVCLTDGRDPDERSPQELADILGEAESRLLPQIRGKASGGDLQELARGFSEMAGDGLFDAEGPAEDDGEDEE